MPTRVAVLGAGRIGQVHGRAIADVRDAELAAVADPVSSAAEAMCAEYNCANMTIDEIEAANDIDAVIICTPTDTHADLIERFARAGKAIFCEKPIDLSVQRVRECLAVVEETNATLMVGFNRRFDPDFNALRASIKNGTIGDVEMINITSRDPGPPPYEYIERSGGIFRDMMIHDLDVARWLLEEEVESVIAAASVLVDPEIGKRNDYDSANVILTTATGKQVSISNSRRAAYGYDQRIEVLGSKGAVSAKNMHTANIEVATKDGYCRPPLLDFFMTRYISAYAIEISAFVEAVTNGSAPPATGHDGLMSLALADAAILSVKEARTVAVSEILNA